MRLPGVRELTLAGIISNRLFAAEYSDPELGISRPARGVDLELYLSVNMYCKDGWARTISASILQCHHSGRGPHRFSHAVIFNGRSLAFDTDGDKEG